MNFQKLLCLSLAICSFELTIHPELLIVKKIDGIFAPLTKEESIIHGPTISNILLKYQWPMCIAADLTEEEQNALLTENKPYQEELFIQEKLRQAIPDLDISVIFIPTSLYELFCIFEYLSHCSNFDYLFELVQSKKPSSFQIAGTELESRNSKWYINLNDLLNTGLTTIPTKKTPASLAIDNHSYQVSIIRKQIYQIYEKINALFFYTDNPIFSQNSYENASLYINNSLITLLFTLYPELAALDNTLQISSQIQNNHIQLTSIFTQKLSPAQQSQFMNSSMKRMIDAIFDKPKNQIIMKVIDLEYEARELNKALLLRGTLFMEHKTGLGKKPKQQKLAGSTLYEESNINFSQTSQNVLYSISFGNSLFAGFIQDAGACAYYYLTKDEKSTGYALLINKKEALENHLRLFFIPPLACLSALFGYGEYFHARTTIANLKKKEINMMKYNTIGLADDIKDPAGIIYITKDPLRHAEQFSNFIAKNGRLIQAGDETTLIKEEKESLDAIIKAQSDAAQFYKAIRTTKPRIKKAVEKHRKKKSDKALHDQSMQNASIKQ